MSQQKKEPRIGNIVAIERALHILEVLYCSDREMGVNEIAQLLGEYQSTVYRAIATLEANGYIYQNQESSKYALGMKMYLMGRAVRKNSILIKSVEPYAKALAEKFNQTVNVALRDDAPNGDSYYARTIYQVKSRNRVLSLSEAVDQIWECYSSSLGKALLAYSDDVTSEGIHRMKLRAFTPKTITAPEKLIAELEKIRVLGYAVDDEEQELGLFCVGCPVLDEKGTAVLAISVSGFVGNMKEIGVEQISTTLKEVCAEISRLVL